MNPTIWMPSRILERNVGGNTTYTRALAEGLAARDFEVRSIPAARHAVRTAWAETRFARKRLPAGQLLHFTADTGPLLGATSPCVLTVHGIASRWVEVARTPTQERVWRGRVAAAIKAADRVVTVSNSSADDISAVFGLDPAKLRVIPHGIAPRYSSGGHSLNPAVGARLPERFALYLGNLEPRKNLVELVRAFDRAPLRDLGVSLVIAGRKAWNYGATMDAIEASDKTVYLDYVADDDVVALMRRCEIFVFPSLYEGFGFPVVEALACGAAVLASNRGSLPEVSGPALVVDDLSADGIARALRDALDDDDRLEECRNSGPAWAARFQWDRSVDAHIEVYRELLS